MPNKKSAVQEKIKCDYKSIDSWDLRLVKLGVAAAILTLVSGFKSFGIWVMSVQWYWFFIAMIIFAIRPFKRFYCKRR
jgi:hypothetical protein